MVDLDVDTGPQLKAEAANIPHYRYLQNLPFDMLKANGSRAC